MKAAIYRGIREFEVTEVKTPEPKENEVLVKVDYCSICGSDLHGYTRGLWTAPGLIMGHEYAGTVVKVGPKAEAGVEVGQRVCVCGLTPCGVCDKCIKGFPHLCPHMHGSEGGAYAEYTLPPAPGTLKMFFPLPDNVSTLEAAMIEPLAVALHAVKLAKYNLNDTICIFGAGTLGLLAAQAVKAVAGASKVIQVDVSQKRLDLAKTLGAEHVINAAEADVLVEIEKIVGSCPNPYGHTGWCDVVIECAGTPITVKQAQQVVKGGGQIVSIALTETDAAIDIPALVQKEVTWKGSYAYVHEYGECLALVSSGKIRLKPLITDVFPLDQINEAFERQLDTKNSIKVIMDCRS